METETLSFAEDLCPKDIVTQLLEIAKAHDALDEIGGATSWRWQEGIISRMPKTKTVAKVLRKAYCSEDPIVWFNKTSGPLKAFIRNSMIGGKRELSSFEPRDIYDSLFMVLIVNGRGSSFDELVTNLAKFKFIKNNSLEDKISFKFDLNLAIEIYGEWAKNKVDELINLYQPKKDGFGFYHVEGNIQFLSENYFFHQLEIHKLRISEVGASSETDMWRFENVALSDSEMIYIEKKILEFKEELDQDIAGFNKLKNRDHKKIMPRMISFTLNTIPVNEFGGLQ